MKKGVVMLVTLALVMLLTLVVLRSTTTTENYLFATTDAMYDAQFNRTFLDMTGIIKDATKTIKDEDMFSALLEMPIIISDEKSGLDGILSLSSAAGKININHILDQDANTSSTNQVLYDVLYSLMMDHQVADGSLFLSLVLDLVDNDTSARVYGSEIAHEIGSSVWDGGITNKKAFEKILEYYVKITADSNIYNVPWDKIISFNGKKIDYNYLNSHIKAVLERDYDISIPYDDSLVKKDSDLSLSKEQKDVLKALRVEYYVPRLACSFNFTYMNKNRSIDFIYDLERRRISNIETIF